MRVLSLVGALMLATTAAADEKSDAYVKEGKLVKAIEIRDVQGGFAGFTGQAWVLDPSGKWMLQKVFNQKREVQAQGELKKEQLTVLAAEFAKYDLAGLASKGKVTTNPRVVTIKFGDKEAVLNMGTTEALPKPDAGSVEGRYSGIVNAVQGVLKGGTGPGVDR